MDYQTVIFGSHDLAWSSISSNCGLSACFDDEPTRCGRQEKDAHILPFWSAGWFFHRVSGLSIHSQVGGCRHHSVLTKGLLRILGSRGRLDDRNLRRTADSDSSRSTLDVDDFQSFRPLHSVLRYKCRLPRQRFVANS